MTDTQLNELLRQGKLTMMILKDQTWTPCGSRCRAVKGLRKWYWRMVISGEAVGYKFVTIHEECIGRPSRDYK